MSMTIISMCKQQRQAGAHNQHFCELKYVYGIECWWNYVVLRLNNTCFSNGKPLLAAFLFLLTFFSISFSFSCCRVIIIGNWFFVFLFSSSDLIFEFVVSCVHSIFRKLVDIFEIWTQPKMPANNVCTPKLKFFFFYSLQINIIVGFLLTCLTSFEQKNKFLFD